MLRSVVEYSLVENQTGGRLKRRDGWRKRKKGSLSQRLEVVVEMIKGHHFIRFALEWSGGRWGQESRDGSR
jgi:hypothetical protein